jgi:ABC-type transport system involved in multi-copper enzyme maturation permease subunit
MKQKSGVKGQKAGSRSKVEDQSAEVLRQMAEVRDQMAEVRRQDPGSEHSVKVPRTAGPAPAVPASFSTVKHLTRDTFRQACASGICWMMLAVTGICFLLCLSVSLSGDATLYAKDEPGFFLPPPTPRTVVPTVVAVFGGSGPLQTAALTAVSQKDWFSLQSNPALAQKEGVETIRGRMTLAFGAISIPLGRERSGSIHFLELVLAGGIAGTLGLLLALVWTAGFLPTFLAPSAASVLLAKPVARWQLLLGKYCGVLTFVGFQVALFVISTWLALGLRSGIWDMTYWWCIPLLLLQFAIFYSFSVLLAVYTRSTVACVFGALLFWLLAWGINYGSLMARSLNESQSLPPVTRALAEGAYWISPKPIDAGLILFNALNSEPHFEKPAVFGLLDSGRGFSPLLSILSSLVITGVLLGLSAYEFRTTDY